MARGAPAAWNRAGNAQDSSYHFHMGIKWIQEAGMGGWRGSVLLAVVSGLMAGAVSAAPMAIRVDRSDGIPNMLDAEATV